MGLGNAEDAGGQVGGGRSRGPTPLFPGANSGNPPAARAPSRGAAGGAAGGSPGMRGRWPPQPGVPRAVFLALW